MKKIDGINYFGFFEGTPYGLETDNVKDLEAIKNTISLEKVTAHFGTLLVGYMAEPLGSCRDLYTDEVFYAGIYEDEDFRFTTDFRRYYEGGKMGLPQEYEEYLKRIL